MPSKGANELNSVQKDREIEDKLRTQINGIKALIEQNVGNYIPRDKEERIDVLEINYSDYLPLGEVDYNGLNCVVHYERKTYDEHGNQQIVQEYMAFSLDDNGKVNGNLARIDENGLIEIDEDFNKKLKESKNIELVKKQNDKVYLVRQDGKLQTVDEKEKMKIMSAEEAEKQEIAQNYRKMRGQNTEDLQEDSKEDDILSITEIEDPSTFAKVLELPLEQVNGKYKLVRFKLDKFILVDEHNEIKAGIEISEFATDIHRELNLRPEDSNATIKTTDIEPATTEPRKV